MKLHTSLKLGHKLPILIIGSALLLTVVLISISTAYFRRSVLHDSETFLSSLVRDRELALHTYLEGVGADIATVAAMPSTASALQWMSMTWDGIGGDAGEVLRKAYIDDNPNPAGEKHFLLRAPGDLPYHMHHARYHNAFRAVMDRMGFYDAFLINPAGEIVYSVFKEADYGTSLTTGPYSDSGLAEAFDAAANGEPGVEYYSDLSPYAPSNGAPAAFTAIQVANDKGEYLGVLALQIPIEQISRLITNLGERTRSLDVYLAGTDMKARTASRFEGRHTVLQPLPELRQVASAFASTDTQIHQNVPGAGGSQVIAASGPVHFRNLHWAVVAEQDMSEVMEPAVKQQRTMIAIAAVCALIVSFFGWLFARSVTRPLARICSNMEAVSSGALDTAVPDAARGDEIGKIGQTLVSMQDDLRMAREAEEARAEAQREQQAVVENLSAGLVRLAGGDLTEAITTPFPQDHEQLRHDFNLTVETLNGVVKEVVGASASIRNGAAEISQASDDLSNRTESQAATLEETAAALDELTASVKSAAEGARSVEATMSKAKAEAETSGEIVQSAVAAMTEIEESSKHISQIISVIDDIAFQTNLLALNAGVEAARAGEAGKGFAVVASEVRALAQRSSDAAMEIKSLIGDSSKQVERGVDLVGKTGEALQSIVAQVSHISQLVSGIAEGAAEQSTGLGEINTGMTQLDQVTQQNAAMVEQSTAAGHMLNSDATKLAGLVAHFRTGGEETAAASAQDKSAAPRGTAPAPTAHGGGDWEIEASPAPAKPEARRGSVAAASSAAAAAGNAARDLWQDF
ncbi:methyl-accepting chemotaxis protein [Cribrihabitans neustonicus]|uniref:methyl-accepting chemotaxis protein n=1 Tax=Cribrihabitans neustonicus TaxID=1429085 RepID=UPI003B5ACE7E